MWMNVCWVLTTVNKTATTQKALTLVAVSLGFTWIRMDTLVLVGEINYFPHVPEFDVLDVDECTEGTDECDHNCHNTDGSYTCSCNGGYTLHSNGFTCIGKSYD